jgi:hypothetical protein
VVSSTTAIPAISVSRLENSVLAAEKHARWEAGLIDPVSAIQPAPTPEHQHREGLSFWQAVKTMFR